MIMVLLIKGAFSDFFTETNVKNDTKFNRKVSRQIV